MEVIMSEELFCKFCHKEFKRECGLAIHERTCKSNPNRKPLENHVCNFPHNVKSNGWKCNICQAIFRTKSDLLRHRHDLSHNTQIHQKSLYKCSFCNKQWETTIEGFKTHEKFCIENPNRNEPHSHPVSEDVKKRISEKQKENYKGRPAFNINRSQEPYSEKYFREWLEKENIEYKKDFHVDRFFLDFAFPDKKLYFEINGEQHYRKMSNGRDHQEHDKERANILVNLGWTCITTIRWSEFTALSINERLIVLNKLKYSIQNSSIVDFNFSYIYDLKHEQSVKREQIIKSGKVNSLGRICNNKITDEEMNLKKQLIINSDIDLTKFGWIEKVSKITGLTRRQIYKIVNSTDLINYVYRR
jgi:very-short-patch-repair endonuclease